MESLCSPISTWHREILSFAGMQDERKFKLSGPSLHHLCSESILQNNKCIFKHNFRCHSTFSDTVRLDQTCKSANHKRTIKSYHITKKRCFRSCYEFNCTMLLPLFEFRGALEVYGPLCHNTMIISWVSCFVWIFNSYLLVKSRTINF